MRQWLPIVIIVGVFGALGMNNLPIWHGNTEAEAQRLQARLNLLPLKLGDWVGEPQEITEKMLTHAEAKGHLSRIYRKPDVPQPISVLVLIGSPGAMGAHTPEFCYEGLGFERSGRVEKLPIPGEPGSELWTTHFDKPNDPGLPPLQVNWAHGVGGRWLASDRPRLDFAQEALIFKVYVSRHRPRTASYASETVDHLPDFLELFFREFRTVVPGPS